MKEFKMEHVLMLAIVAFLSYHLLDSCRGDSFSVGAVNCDPTLTNPKQLCPNNIPCPECGSNVCQCPPPHPPPPPSPRKISLRPKHPSKFVKRINEVYENPHSNGVFISMIFNIPFKIKKLKTQIEQLEKQKLYSIKNKKIEILNNLKNHENIYLDGSGSIMRKDIYPYLFGGSCDFGFIWDTNWLEKKLVDCFFPEDAYTTPFGHGTKFNKCIQNNVDYCRFAGKSSRPDRCSKGLNIYANDAAEMGLPIPPNPTNCTTNKIYDIDTLKKINQSDGKNCFSYTVDLFKNKGPLDYDNISSAYNEAVFLKDIHEDGIEINKGLSMLKKLNKPFPVAILFLDSDKKSCNKGDAVKITYNNLLKGLKSNFNGDTIVIKTTGKCGPWEKCNFDDNYTTLDQMPGYDDV
jgi:hypothetical protein